LERDEDQEPKDKGGDNVCLPSQRPALSYVACVGGYQ
jgi:hypothetical protein